MEIKFRRRITMLISIFILYQYCLFVLCFFVE